MNEQPPLPGFPVPPSTPAPTSESAQRRRTRRQREAIARGVHPLTRQPLAENGETCGSCRHLFRRAYAGTYFKCELASTSSSAATDARKSWPACAWWEASE